MTENWSSVVQSVENANVQAQSFQKHISELRKVKYREELDREVMEKNKIISDQNSVKRKERNQIEQLALMEQRKKIQDKIKRQSVERKYGTDNKKIISSHQESRLKTQKPKYSENPFVKLVDGQDSRKQQSREGFITQNKINDMQLKLKNRTASLNRAQELKQRDQYVDSVERQFEKRSQQRESLKNKNQIPESGFANISDLSAERGYIKYLNNRIEEDRRKKIEQKEERIVDPKISKFYNKALEPDSSPAYLGRNSYNYQRKRQLNFLNKHLGISADCSRDSNLSQKLVLPNLKSAVKMSERQALRGQKGHSSVINIEKSCLPEDSYNESKRQSHVLNPQKFNKILPSKHNNPQHAFDSSLKKQQLKNVNNQQSLKRGNDQTNLRHEGGRRIKSELQQEFGEKCQFKETNLTSHERSNPQQPPKTSQPKRQFARYDLITGNRTSFYA